VKYIDLQEFFDLYIKNFLPFRDDPFYQKLMNYLLNYYYDKLYNQDPEIFKKIWEDQIIPYEVLDNILISLGYPPKILKNFTIREKILILNFFHDIYGYKASIEFIKRLFVFDEEIGIYELYLDRESNGSWVYKPRLIQKHENISELSNISFPFEDIYRQIPSLLYSEEFLEEQYQSVGLSLPIKSNILLLDYHHIREISLINDFIVAVFLREYYESEIGLYFYDNYFFTTLWKIYYLWYYIFSKFFVLDNQISENKILWKAKKDYANRKYIRMIYNPLKLSEFYIDGKTNYKTIDKYSYGTIITEKVPDMKKLDDILNWYKSIQSREEMDKFYKEIFIKSNFHQVVKEMDVSFKTLKFSYSILDPKISNYIDQRLEGTLDPKSELFRILDEIYNSLLLFIERSKNTNLKNYGKNYFLKSLPQIAISPKETKTYIMLYNFKPFHTELLSDSTIGLIVPPSDKFNKVFVDSEAKQFIFELFNASILDFSYEYAIFDIEIPKISDLSIFSSIISIFELKTQMSEILNDDSNNKNFINNCSINNISDDYEISP